MKILLTGITGNLGIELSQELRKKGHDIYALIRNENYVSNRDVVVLTGDLVKGIDVEVIPDDIECIIHCAGDVRFDSDGKTNLKMTETVIKIATKIHAPIVYISTAFLYRQKECFSPRNNYEDDKFKSEEALRNSGVRHIIARPSVLTGNSIDGSIKNFTGYYTMVDYFIKVYEMAKTKNYKIRFPRLVGNSNIIPTNIAAESIVGILDEGVYDSSIRYISNPEPPSAQWLLNETLSCLGIKDGFEIINMSFSDYLNLSDKKKEEELLCHLGLYLSQYWALDYNFPKPFTSKFNITEDYVRNILSFYKRKYE